MIIASAMMEAVSGINLARAFSTMGSTSKIPFVLLTSFGRGHAELRGLPEDFRILRHDQDLDGEITELMQQLS